jgi:hypothetical protein
MLLCLVMYEKKYFLFIKEFSVKSLGKSLRILLETFTSITLWSVNPTNTGQDTQFQTNVNVSNSEIVFVVHV